MIRVSFTYPDEWKKYVKRQTEELTISNYLRILLEIDLHNAYFFEESENCREIIKSHLDDIIDFIQTLDFSLTYHEISGIKLKTEEISINANEVKETMAEDLESPSILNFSWPLTPFSRFLVLNLDLQELTTSWANAVTAYINYLTIKKYINESELLNVAIIHPDNYSELLKLKEHILKILVDSFNKYNAGENHV